MSFRQSDPDDTQQFFRNIEDRLRKLEARTNDQSRQSTKELRLRSSKRLSSMMVIGDSISQFDRCNRFDAGERAWVRGTGSNYRWQDQLADQLGGIGGVTRIAPTFIGPFDGVTLLDTPVLVSEGKGSFVQWDYTVPGASTSWWMSDDGPYTKYRPPEAPVDLLCVMLGCNDHFLGDSPATFKANYQRILESYPHTFAVVIIPWEQGILSPTAHPWAEYVAALQSLSGASTSVVQPVVGVPGPSLSYDRLHPTQAGHDAILASVAAAVSSLTKPDAARVSITASKMGAVVQGGVVIGNWRITVSDNGELVATNLLNNQDTVLAS